MFFDGVVCRNTLIYSLYVNYEVSGSERRSHFSWRADDGEKDREEKESVDEADYDQR